MMWSYMYVRRQVVPQSLERRWKRPDCHIVFERAEEGEDVARPTEVVLWVGRYELSLQYTRGLIRARFEGDEQHFDMLKILLFVRDSL